MVLVEINGLGLVPAVSGLQIHSERKSIPSTLTCNLALDPSLIEMGAAIKVYAKSGEVCFFGFIFSMQRTKENTVLIKAYDQLIYLVKNTDTYVFKNKKASDMLAMIASDFRLNLGSVYDTGLTFKHRIEDNKPLIDILNKALDETLIHTRKMYILYDEGGFLCLKPLSLMKTNVLITAAKAEDYAYEVSIDKETYNKVKISLEQEVKGKRKVYIAQDSANINRWGVLQKTDTAIDAERAKAKADGLLKMYNKERRFLKIRRAKGSFLVRGGKYVDLALSLGDRYVYQSFIVERCTHTVENELHYMDLDLRGGDFY